MDLTATEIADTSYLSLPHPPAGTFRQCRRQERQAPCKNGAVLGPGRFAALVQRASHHSAMCRTSLRHQRRLEPSLLTCLAGQLENVANTIDHHHVRYGVFIPTFSSSQKLSRMSLRRKSAAEKNVDATCFWQLRTVGESDVSAVRTGPKNTQPRGVFLRDRVAGFAVALVKDRMEINRIQANEQIDLVTDFKLREG